MDSPTKKSISVDIIIMLSGRYKDGPHGQGDGLGGAGRQAQLCQPHLLLEVESQIRLASVMANLCLVC